ncbi:tRNA selenocysteine 1-associated protein 1-like isoform X2 [Ptychodera flava]|uniref:tRNA selenocysteine 1-associated protein 1-like isoform X2 n=1 Tax=Ptychodera flava TaxID=63121 RepID=UPI00396A0A27
MTSTTLWMGDVEPYWDENFIKSAFQQHGEIPTAVKMMKNRATGGQARYCFVDFANAQISERLVMTLNGKPVPNSSPPRLFKLNFAVFGMQAPPNPYGGGRKEFSLFIGELTPEVEDYALYNFFSRRYPSIKGAKVILDNAGISRGFGFVRFGSEEEQQTALTEMQGITGLGGRALRVSVATPKKPRPPEGGDTWSAGVGSWGSGGGASNTWNPDGGNSWNSGSAGGGGGSWNSGNQYGGGSQGWGSQGNYQGNWESGNTWGGGSGGQQQQSSWGGTGAGANTGSQQNSWTGGQQGSWAGQDTWGGSGGNQGSWTGGQQYNQYQGYQQGQY